MKEFYSKEWTRIPWDGNPDLNLECWRKAFGHGHVSVGIGDFLLVVFSFGADSDWSHSSTRWNYDNPPIPEEAMMLGLDEAWRNIRDNNFTTPKHLYDDSGWRQNKNGALLECSDLVTEGAEIFIPSGIGGGGDG